MTNSVGYPLKREGGLAVGKILLTVPEAAAALANIPQQVVRAAGGWLDSVCPD